MRYGQDLSLIHVLAIYKTIGVIQFRLLSDMCTIIKVEYILLIIYPS